MVERGLINLEELVRLFERVTPDLLRYPAINEQAFRSKLARIVTRLQGDEID